MRDQGDHQRQDTNNLNLYWWSIPKAAHLMGISETGVYFLIARGHFPEDAVMDVEDIGVFLTPSSVLKVTNELRLATMRQENREDMLNSIIGMGHPIKPTLDDCLRPDQFADDHLSEALSDHLDD